MKPRDQSCNKSTFCHGQGSEHTWAAQDAGIATSWGGGESTTGFNVCGRLFGEGKSWDDRSAKPSSMSWCQQTTAFHHTSEFINQPMTRLQSAMTNGFLQYHLFYCNIPPPRTICLRSQRNESHTDNWVGCLFWSLLAMHKKFAHRSSLSLN